jgi:hypothetical protein
MSDAELHRAVHGLERDGAAAWAFGLELRIPLVLPVNHYALCRIDLHDVSVPRVDDRDRVPGDSSTGGNHTDELLYMCG